MEHTTPATDMDMDAMDLDALEAEIDALIAADAEMDARVDALLDQPVVPYVTIQQQMAALWARSAENTAALNEIEREQQELDRQISALEVDA